MDKVKLVRVFRAYIEGLKADGKLRLRDALIQFIIPVVVGMATFLYLTFVSEDISRVEPIVANAISAVSIISGLMCALAVLVFQLRVQLSSEKTVKVKESECSLVDHLFNDALWDVVVGLLCVLLFVISSGAINGESALFAVLLAISSAMAMHFLFVTAMCIKRLSIAYEIVSKAWGKQNRF